MKHFYSTVNMKPQDEKSPATRDGQNDDFATTIKKTIEEMLRSTDIVKFIAEAVTDIVTKKVIERLEENIGFNTSACEDLKKQFSDLEEEVNRLKQECAKRDDELEQYQRRNNLRVFGIAENDKENCDELVMRLARQIGVDIGIADIDRSHRVGQKKAGSIRPIIMKLVSYQKRRELFFNKRHLKGTGTTIREDLTASRMQLLQDVINKVGVKNTWTVDGTIFIRHGSTKKKIAAKEDIQQLGKIK